MFGYTPRRSVSAEFHRPVFFDDEVTITFTVESVGRTSATYLVTVSVDGAGWSPRAVWWWCWSTTRAGPRGTGPTTQLPCFGAETPETMRYEPTTSGVNDVARGSAPGVRAPSSLFQL